MREDRFSAEFNRLNIFAIKNTGGHTMKKIKTMKLWLIGAALVVAGFAGQAQAVTSQALDIHVSINATKSLTAATTYYNFGALAVNFSSVSLTALTITNNSAGLVETYTMIAGNAVSDSGGTNWTLASSAGSDQYALAGQFSTAQPNNLDANWASDDLTSSAVVCTSTQFGNGTAGESGAAVAPSAARSLWLRIKTPTQVNDAGSHTATITVAVQ